jgi:hypothetical protein
MHAGWSEVFFSGGVALVSSVIGAWIGGYMVRVATREQAKREGEFRRRERELDREWHRLDNRTQIVHEAMAWMARELAGAGSPDASLTERAEHRSHLARLSTSIRLVVDGDESSKLLDSISEFQIACRDANFRHKPTIEDSNFMNNLKALTASCGSRRKELEELEISTFPK